MAEDTWYLISIGNYAVEPKTIKGWKWASSFISCGESKVCITSDSHKWQRQMMNILFAEPMEKAMEPICWLSASKTYIRLQIKE